MTRAISTAYLRELLSPNSEVYGLLFLTLSHPSLATPIRVVNDATQIKSGAAVPYILNGKTYTAYPFSLALLPDDDDIPETKLTIQNVDRTIGNTIKKMPADQPVKISLAIYQSSDFEINGGGTAMVAVGTPTLQYSCPTAFIRGITVDASRVTGSIRLYDPSRELAVYLKASPEVAPGVHIS